MTNEQIIIDYKNLCENYSKEVGCYNTFDGSCIKEQCFTYRLLQLLQAKEQECESLNKRASSLEEIADDLQQRNHHLTQECEGLKEELNLLKNNEDLLISELQVLWGKQIAEEQGDCKNIDYSKPRTREIYHKITEIDRTLKDVAFAQSVNIGKTKPLGDTGSPRSYKRWEKRERQLLEREIFKG